MPKPKKEQQFLCFVHIEKAGGITMHALLHKLFIGYVSPSPAFGEHFTAQHLAGFKRYWPFPFNGIGGHRMGAWLQYESVINRPIFYFTFLRNPHDRYLSHLNWQLHIKKNYTQAEDFIANPYFDNFQCYRIAGKQNEKKAREMLKKQFAFVGLLEEYDSSLLLWRQALRKPQLDIRYSPKNKKDYGAKTIRKEDLPDRLWQKVKEKNKRDKELYQWVKEELFPRQKQNYGSNLNRDLATFRQMNAAYTFPVSVHLKRRISNWIAAKIAQPLSLQTLNTTNAE